MTRAQVLKHMKKASLSSSVNTAHRNQSSSLRNAIGGVTFTFLLCSFLWSEHSLIGMSLIRKPGKRCGKTSIQ